MKQRDAFMERFKRFEKRFDLYPRSYRLRNPDGSLGGWIANVEVWESRAKDSLVTPIGEESPKVYERKAQADFVALWTGLEWLEKTHSL